MTRSDETPDALGLLSLNPDVDEAVDLRGMGSVEALARVEAAIREHASRAERRILFAFDLARPGGGQTLFRPVGERLRQAVADGEAVRAMPAAGGGWIVRLGRTETAD